MLVIKDVDVTISDIDSRNISWEFESTTENLDSYTVYVYRSEAPGGVDLSGFEVVSPLLSANAYGYVDISIANLYDPGRTWFYKIKVQHVNTGDSVNGPETAAYVRDESDDPIYNEIVRRKSLVLNSYSGRPLKILKRRTFGTHCTECWDSTLMRIRWDDCSECHGTGWLNGYFGALGVKGMMNPAPEYNQITMYGEWRPSDSLLTILNFPPLTIRDVIVDESNKRWAIRAVRTIEKKGFIIEQNAQCSLISMDDKVYDIDAN